MSADATPPPEEPKRSMPSDEEIRALLKQGARRERAWTWRSLVVLLMLAGGLFTVCLWFVWPARRVPNVIIVAYDGISPPKQLVQIDAELQALDEDAAGQVQAWLLSFEDVQASEPQWQEQARTNAVGKATVERRLPAGPQRLEYRVRLVAPDNQETREDRSLWLTVPTQTKLLLIDVEYTLASLPVAAWQQTNSRDMPAKPNSHLMLAEIARRGIQIVYCSASSSGPGHYTKVRSWLRTPTSKGETWPLGPLLPCTTRVEAATYLQVLRRQFPGWVAGLSDSEQTRQMFEENGMKVVYVTQIFADGEDKRREPEQVKQTEK